jgi:FtsP/CotA-like multicopper oxidase with cupredoxin domain
VHVGTPHQGFSDTTGGPRIPFTEGAPLSQPEVRRSVNSELRTTLRVQYAYKRSIEPGQSYDIEIAIPADHMVEEWTLVNLHFHDHIFHIHTNPFQLTKVNGKALAEPVWLDTAVLPRNGSLTFRSRFLDFTGRYMLHCHMMNHEELGMMQVVEVYADA